MTELQLSAPDLHALLQGSAGPVPLLLDVRETWERERCRIDGPSEPSLHMPMGEVTARFGELDPLHPVVCYCHHGVRSLQVVAFLRRQGLQSVYNLAGGIEAWSLAVDPAVPRY